MSSNGGLGPGGRACRGPASPKPAHRFVVFRIYGLSAQMNPATSLRREVSVPIFEYRCEKCGEEFEEIVSSDERDRPQACPACGSKRTKRLISAFASGGCGTCSSPKPT